MHAATTRSTFDTPGTTDNRAYDYEGVGLIERTEYPVIEQWVPSGARVLDLGCGNGSLLHRLTARGASGIGWDISPSGVAACRARGLDAEVREIDRPHPDVPDKAFDLAICNVTIQMTMRPEVLFREMVRVATRQIVSFPNFGHYRNRLDLLLRGRMPQPLLFGYSWYNTGHIHQFSVRDFHALVREVGGTRVRAMAGLPARTIIGRTLRSALPNLLELIPIFLLG